MIEGGKRIFGFLGGSIVILSFLFGFQYYHLWLLYWGEIISSEMAYGLTQWGRFFHGFFLLGVGVFMLGLIPYCKRVRYIRLLGRLNIKAGLDCMPKLLRVVDLEDHRKRLILSSVGVGLDRYENRKRDIEAVFNARLENIRIGRSPSLVEITLTTKTIPIVCHYQKSKEKITKAYSFVVGEGLQGAIVKSILDFPGGHLLIAGTTGGGKSNWFKACLLSLLETSFHAEFFLLDFKGGVEFMPFSQFPNVSVEKDMEGALRKLRMVVAEMNRRFSYLESKERSSIVPKRDRGQSPFCGCG